MYLVSASVTLALSLRPAMVHRCARGCSQLRAGALSRGLLLGLTFGAVRGEDLQKKHEGKLVEVVSKTSLRQLLLTLLPLVATTYYAPPTTDNLPPTTYYSLPTT